MSIEVGSKLQGKVTGITHFGAFVELLGGTTGLVHISEVADSYVKDINEVLTVGDEVLVKVVNVEKDGKIGLSIRKAKEQTEDRQASEVRRPVRSGSSRGGQRNQRATLSFEDKMNRFLRDSEERLSMLRRQTDSKRGGRGSRRG